MIIDNANAVLFRGVPCPFGTASAFGSSNLSHSPSSSKAARKISFDKTLKEVCLRSVLNAIHQKSID